MIIEGKMTGKRIIKKFAQLSFKMKLLFLGCLVLSGIIRLFILLIPFRFLAPWVGKEMADSPKEIDPAAYRKVLKISWAIHKICTVTPWESKCLVQAMTGAVLLKFFRIPYTLYLGLDKNEIGKLTAHAWLRSGSLIVTGGNEKDKFTPVAQFAFY